MKNDLPLSPAALTIAGSDSGGNAGIQADLRAFHVFGVHSCTAITALTAQNPFGVSHIQPTDPQNLSEQLERICSTYTLGAIKTGMLVNANLIRVITSALITYPMHNLIIDPVMIATSGSKLISDESIDALKSFFTHASVITPNIPEAETILGRTITTLNDRIKASKTLSHLYTAGILIKGGHCSECPELDIFTDSTGTYKLSTPRIDNPISTHGTGCSLSAAIAASLARNSNQTLIQAVTQAKAYIYEAIRTSIRIGENCTVLGTPTYATIPTEIVTIASL